MNICTRPGPVSDSTPGQLLITAPDLRERLLDRGVDTVSADYDGMDGAGRIECIGYGDSLKPGSILSPDAVTQEDVEALLLALLTLRHPGWENCDGGFGSFAWNLTDHTLEHRHHQRHTHYETFCHEGFEA